MNTAKIYYDIDQNPCTIFQIIKREPEWAANRIQEGEKAIEKLKRITADSIIKAHVNSKHEGYILHKEAVAMAKELRQE